jgi:hypothetical protein
MERYDPFAFQSLSASGPLRLVLRPDSEKKRTTLIHLLLRLTWLKERYDPFAFQSLSASGPLRLVSLPASEKKRTTFIHLLLSSPPGGRSDTIHSPSSPFQPLDLSGLCYGQPQRKRGRLSFTSSCAHLAEGAILSIRLPVPLRCYGQPQRKRGRL